MDVQINIFLKAHSCQNIFYCQLDHLPNYLFAKEKYLVEQSIIDGAVRNNSDFYGHSKFSISMQLV